jgi:hypothetical protein
MKSDYLRFITHCLWIGLIAGLAYWGGSKDFNRYEFHSINNMPMIYVLDKQAGMVSMLWHGAPQWYQTKWDSNHDLGPKTVWIGKKVE